MRARWTAAVTVFAMLACAPVREAWALATETKGHASLNALNFAEWKDILPLVNQRSRVYEIWINGSEYLYYKSSPQELNAALALFGKRDAKHHVVVLEPGPYATHSFDKQEIPCNWNLQLIGGLSKARATNDISDLDRLIDPVLTIYVDDSLALSKLEIPSSVLLVSKPAKESEPNGNEPAKKRIAAYLEQRKAAENK